MFNFKGNRTKFPICSVELGTNKTTACNCKMTDFQPGPHLALSQLNIFCRLCFKIIYSLDSLAILKEKKWKPFHFSKHFRHGTLLGKQGFLSARDQNLHKRAVPRWWQSMYNFGLILHPCSWSQVRIYFLSHNDTKNGKGGNNKRSSVPSLESKTWGLPHGPYYAFLLFSGPSAWDIKI